MISINHNAFKEFLAMHTIESIEHDERVVEFLDRLAVDDHTGIPLARAIEQQQEAQRLVNIDAELRARWHDVNEARYHYIDAVRDDRHDEQQTTITVEVRGGIVEEISGIPKGVTILVKDHDIEAEDETWEHVWTHQG